MHRFPDVSAILLAGGRSTRMGTDKALLPWRGRTLLEHGIALLSELSGDVMVASGTGERFRQLQCREVADVLDDGGPLAGVAAGLRAARHPTAFVLAVDMPFAGAAVFEVLAGRTNQADVIVPEGERGLEPLHAVWAATALPVLERRLRSRELDVMGALGELRTVVVRRGDLREADPSLLFATNVNTPEDVADLTHR